MPEVLLVELYGTFTYLKVATASTDADENRQNSDTTEDRCYSHQNGNDIFMMLQKVVF